MKDLPANILKYAEVYNFSKNLVTCLTYINNYLSCNIYINVTRSTEFFIEIDVTSFSGDHEKFNVRIPYDSSSAEAQQRYDEMAKLILTTFFGSEISTIPSIRNTANGTLKNVFLDDIKVHEKIADINFQNFYNKVLLEIKSRGDFNINISKFVDLLFKLGVIEENMEVKNDDF